MKQTAVEWLINEIAEKYNFRFSTFYSQEINQAKAMEKEQIIADGTMMVNYAKLINKEKTAKRSKQKKYTNVMSENKIKRMYTEEDIVKAFQKGWESREPQYDGGWKTTLTAQDYINSLNKQD